MARLYSRSAALREPEGELLEQDSDGHEVEDFYSLPIATQRARQRVNGSGRTTQDAFVLANGFKDSNGFA